MAARAMLVRKETAAWLLPIFDERSGDGNSRERRVLGLKRVKTAK